MSTEDFLAARTEQSFQYMLVVVISEREEDVEERYGPEEIEI